MKIKNTKNDNGLNEIYYDNGKIAKKYYKKGGKRDGLYQRWHNNGQLKFEGLYKDGKSNGLLRAWHPDGKLGEPADWNGFRQRLARIRKARSKDQS